MKNRRWLAATEILISALLIVLPAHALELRSDKEAATTVELYTSECCSSCPNADAWLSSLSDDPAIFSHIIPLAFHVDYWNQLGWDDRFSAPIFSDRQRQLRRNGMISQVYTPGFVVNNREWRGWFNGGQGVTADQLPRSNKHVGVLAAQWPKNVDTLALSYTPAADDDGNFKLHIAIVGMGLETNVLDGENRGRVLRHDFVVPSHLQYPFGSSKPGETLTKRVAGPKIPAEGQKKSALVVWISKGESPAIVQAVAAYL